MIGLEEIETFVVVIVASVQTVHDALDASAHGLSRGMRVRPGSGKIGKQREKGRTRQTLT